MFVNYESAIVPKLKKKFETKQGLTCKLLREPTISSLNFDSVVFSFLFDKYCLIME